MDTRALPAWEGSWALGKSAINRWPFTGHRLFLLLSLAVSWALSGCAFLQPREDLTRFFVLTAPSVQPSRVTEGDFKRWKVGLRPVEVPAYLRSKAMVVRTGTNEVHFAELERWAEPLDQGISRVMKETLSLAGNVENVVLNSHGDDTLDYEVAIRVLACEGVQGPTGNSSIRFAVTWEARPVEKNAAATLRGVFTANPGAWNGRDYGQLAERLSEAIAGAAQAVAAALPLEAQTRGKSTMEKPKP